MLDIELINKLLQIKEAQKYTLFDLSKRLDLQVTTIERWLKTNHINKVYARLVKKIFSID
jgi:predicted transcriptional regulator